MSHDGFKSLQSAITLHDGQNEPKRANTSVLKGTQLGTSRRGASAEIDVYQLKN